MKKRTLSVVLGICLLAAAMVSGCEKKGVEQSPKSDSSKQEEEQGSTDDKAEGSAKSASDVTVRYICLTKGIPYFDPIIEGMKDSVEKAGATFQDTAPDTSDATAQIPLIEAAIQDKVDVICISPSDPDALCATFDKARDAGIIVLCVNDDVTGNEDRRDGAVMSTDYDVLGKENFEAFAESMNYEGKFGALSSKTGTPFQENQMQIYRDMMAEDEKYAKMEFVDVLYGDDEATKSLTEAEAAIQKYPDLKGIISPTTVGIVAAAQAVENAGLTGKIMVSGTGTPSQCKTYLENGTMPNAFLWDTRLCGNVAGTLSVKLATGEVALEAGAEIDLGEYGTVKANDVCLVPAGDPLKFTKENAGEYDY